MSSSLQPLFFSPSLISIFLSLARLRGAGSGGRTLERRCGRPRAEAVAAATQIQPTKFGLPNQAHMGAHTTGPRPITTRARSPETAQNLSLSLSVSSGQLTQPQKRHDIHPPPTATAASNAAPPHAASSFPSPLNNPTASSSKQIHGEPSLSPRPRRRRCSSSDRWSSSLHEGRGGSRSVEGERFLLQFSSSFDPGGGGCCIFFFTEDWRSGFRVVVAADRFLDLLARRPPPPMLRDAVPRRRRRRY